MYLLVTFSYHPIFQKFQNDFEIKIKNGCWQRSTTKCVDEMEQKPNHCKKNWTVIQNTEG